MLVFKSTRKTFIQHAADSSTDSEDNIKILNYIKKNQEQADVWRTKWKIYEANETSGLLTTLLR